MFDAVVTYGWNRVAYNILRSLASKGFKVAVGDSSVIAMSKASKYCSYSFSYPSFYRHPKEFILKLNRIFEVLKPKVYLPTHEETFIVSRFIDKFKDVRVAIPIHDFEVMKTVHQKDSLCKIAAVLGIPIPKTYKPKSIDDLEGIWQEAGNNGKVVIKLLSSNGSKGVFYAHSLEVLVRTYSALIQRNKFSVKDYPIVQEYVNGEGYGVSMLFNRGQLRARFTHKRLREKFITGGPSTKRVSVSCPMIEVYTEKLLSSLNWHGVAMAEYKYDEKNKQAWLIEINPRFWGSLALAINAGMDFPDLVYRMAVDGDVEPVLDYRIGVISRWILGDCLATLDGIRVKHSLKPIKDFLLFPRNECYDDFYMDDPLVFGAECLYYMTKFLKTFSFNPTEESLVDLSKI